ncbi:ribosylnicotinamide kinase [Rhodotorula kratochvilovae]
MSDATTPRVVIAAISGATCSGKTTLAKHLGRIIPSSLLLFQDDFAPPAELVPVDPKHGWQDWDDVRGAILWDEQRETLRRIRATGTLPDEHASHDHLNEQVPVPISEEVQSSWRRRFEELLQRQGEKPTIVIAEGFLMLVDPESTREFDVRLFMREDYAVLKRRREERMGYHTQEGALWRDPPEYWDLCVWPAYLRAHAPLFAGGDVERGEFDPQAIEGVQLLEAKELGMEEMVVRACEAIYEAVESGVGRERWARP